VYVRRVAVQQIMVRTVMMHKCWKSYRNLFRTGVYSVDHKIPAQEGKGAHKGSCQNGKACAGYGPRNSLYDGAAACEPDPG
jgi:hypothetical protein